MSGNINSYLPHFSIFNDKLIMNLNDFDNKLPKILLTTKAFL